MTINLAADVGGTNARFALVDPKTKQLTRVASLKSQDFPSLQVAIESYLEAQDLGQPITSAAIAVASPIAGDFVAFTNNSWSFSKQELEQQLGLKSLNVINDFEAIALSLDHLSCNDYQTIGNGNSDDRAPKAVLGPGTGLGLALLVPNHQGKAMAVATEGGHSSFAAETNKEWQVRADLAATHSHVSNELVLSGQGLLRIFNSLDKELKQRQLTCHDQLAELAFETKDSIAIESFALFFGALGSFAGNVALQTGARGGVYISGGVIPRYLESFVASSFRSRFEAKGRFGKYLADIPTRLITFDQPGLLGAASTMFAES